jgi:hypothetical protein
MVVNQFEALLQELEPFFQCQLTSDQNNSCLIKMKTGIKIQIELDRYGENLLMGIKLGAIPPGRYREMLFKEALKSNHTRIPFRGILGYSKKSSNLILFSLLDIRDVNQEKMITILTALLNKAETWASAISKGDIPFSLAESTINSQPGIFGIVQNSFLS